MREVRPVALDWEHPRQPGSNAYRPLWSRSDLRADLERSEHPDGPECQEPVDLRDYMPELAEGTPFGWQLYETATAGTPLSPVFATKGELAAWMSSPAAGRDQVRPEVAAKFVTKGWAPLSYWSPQAGFLTGVEQVGGAELEAGS